MSSPYAAFRSRPFRFFMAGNFLAVIGRQMLSVCVGWEVYRRTGSALALGLIGLTGALPIITLAIPAGHLADRFSRRAILMGSQLIAACTSVGLACVSFNGASIGWIFLLLFLAGSARTFGWAARGAFMVNLVPKEHFNNAVTWNSSAFGVSSAVGPALAGLLLVHHPYWIIYAIDAACSVAFFLFLLAAPPASASSGARPSGLEGLFDGLRFVWGTKIVLATITLDLFAVLFGGATALLPAFADGIFHAGPQGLGALRSAPAVGAALMAAAIARFPLSRRVGPALLSTVTVFGLATIAFGLSRNFVLSLGMLALAGAADMVSVVIRSNLVQLGTPNEMRGRVNAVENVFIGASNELGEFESGMLAAFIGVVPAVVAGGAGTIAVIAIYALVSPALRRADRFAGIPAAEPP